MAMGCLCYEAGDITEVKVAEVNPITGLMGHLFGDK